MNGEQTSNIDGPQFSAKDMKDAMARAKVEAPQLSAADIAHEKEAAERNARELQQQMAPKPSFMTEPLHKTGPSIENAAPIQELSQLKPPVAEVETPVIQAVNEKQGGFRGFFNKLRGK